MLSHPLPAFAAATASLKSDSLSANATETAAITMAATIIVTLFIRSLMLPLFTALVLSMQTATSHLASTFSSVVERVASCLPGRPTFICLRKRPQDGGDRGALCGGESADERFEPGKLHPRLLLGAWLGQQQDQHVCGLRPYALLDERGQVHGEHGDEMARPEEPESIGADEEAGAIEFFPGLALQMPLVGLAVEIRASPVGERSIGADWLRWKCGADLL